MDELSAAAFKAYRALVYETEGFERYFWESTVIAEIAHLNIGSRPASRKKTTAIEDLRAIPGSSAGRSAGSCCRAGSASAAQSSTRHHGEAGRERLQAMAREWGFFSSLLSNMDMVLAKSDIAIASRYAGWCAT